MNTSPPTPIELAIAALKGAIVQSTPINTSDCDKLRGIIEDLQTVYSEQCPIL